MLGVIADARVFSEILAHKLPKLAAHFKQLGIGIDPIIVRWFLCFFANLLPFEAALRFFDCLLLQGSKFLFRVGLALFKFNERYAGLVASSSLSASQLHLLRNGYHT